MEERKPAEKQNTEATCAGCGARDLKENMVQRGKDEYYCAECAELADDESDTTGGLGS